VERVYQRAHILVALQQQLARPVCHIFSSMRTHSSSLQQPLARPGQAALCRRGQVRRYSGSIKALFRLYSGSIQALFRLCSGSYLRSRRPCSYPTRSAAPPTPPQAPAIPARPPAIPAAVGALCARRALSPAAAAAAAAAAVVQACSLLVCIVRAVEGRLGSGSHCLGQGTLCHPPPPLSRSAPTPPCSSHVYILHTYTCNIYIYTCTYTYVHIYYITHTPEYCAGIA
jgi:hypothetical protein